MWGKWWFYQGCHFWQIPQVCPLLSGVAAMLKRIDFGRTWAEVGWPWSRSLDFIIYIYIVRFFPGRLLQLEFILGEWKQLPSQVWPRGHEVCHQISQVYGLEQSPVGERVMSSAECFRYLQISSKRMENHRTLCLDWGWKWANIISLSREDICPLSEPWDLGSPFLDKDLDLHAADVLPGCFFFFSAEAFT
jgi:hypothetical protein